MRVVFMGSPRFAVPALRALIDRHQVALVVTQPDKPAGRGRELAPPPIKEVALAAGLPVTQPRSARAPEFLEALRAAAPEICVVVAYGKILPPAVLAVAPRGCLNIHGSLLPRYRGAAPIQWAVLRGEPETGVTIMRLDEGMDTGPTLLSRAVPIDERDTAGSMYDKLAPIGADLLLAALDGLARGALRETPQDHGAASYAPMLRKEQGVVTWARPACEVRDHIRGMDPWPVASTLLEGAPLKLFAPESRAGSGGPGVVLGVDAAGLHVACGEGVCVVGEVQAAGKRRMPAAAFAAGRPMRAGLVLGA